MSLIDIGLDQLCTVYTPDPTTGRWTVVAVTAVPCRLAIGSVSGDMNAQRAEAAGARKLLWGPAYAMPEDAQVEIDGERWNIVAGTTVKPRDLGGTVVYRRADVALAVP